MKEETLYENKWISLKKIVSDEHHDYIFSHETSCNGKKVAILPFKEENDHIWYLVRDEVTPCWRGDKKVISSITGGVDEDDIRDVVIKEMQEEAGYSIQRKDLMYLGQCFGTKSCDTVYHLYAVNLTGKLKTIVTTNDPLEAKAGCRWTMNAVEQAEDPLVYVLFIKLLNYLMSVRLEEQNGRSSPIL